MPCLHNTLLLFALILLPTSQAIPKAAGGGGGRGGVGGSGGSRGNSGSSRGFSGSSIGSETRYRPIYTFGYNDDGERDNTSLPTSFEN